MSRRWKIFTLVGLVTIVLDQISKYWARGLPVDDYGRPLPVTVIEGFWDWRLGWNTGSAFGLFSGTSGARVFLTIVGIAALGAIVWMLKQSREDQGRLHWALGLVGGGAVGNLIDRIYFGKVTDFIVWKVQTHEWPTFNVADMALCIGVGLLFLDFGKEAKLEKEEKKRAEQASGGGSGAKRRRGR